MQTGVGRLRKLKVRFFCRKDMADLFADSLLPLSWSARCGAQNRWRVVESKTITSHMIKKTWTAWFLPAQPHVPTDLAHAQPLRSDHLNNLQLKARVKDSSLCFRHFCCPGDLHLSACTKELGH